MELEEAVERPVQQLVPGCIAQARALSHQVSNGQGEVDGGYGKAEVDMAARCVMELRIGAGENLPHDGGARALRAKRGRLLQGRADLEADGAEVVDDNVDRIFWVEGDEKAAGGEVAPHVAHALAALDARSCMTH